MTRIYIGGQYYTLEGGAIIKVEVTAPDAKNHWRQRSQRYHVKRCDNGKLLSPRAANNLRNKPW